MVESVSTQQSLRKALGALKDATKVGLAKVNSDYKELDVAIVKSTNHDEEIAKEKHILKIFDAVSASRPRADVAYCIHGLARRLAKTHNWAVALKTLIVIHRALREVDPTFREELINYSRSRGHMLNLSHFKDDSSPNAWDYSSWVRMYALYLQECLECFHILKYDVEHDHLRTRDLNTPDLLEQLPALQELLFRLLACQPVGAAMYNNMIQYALSIVSGESVRLYAAINDGTLNLVDKFFEMQRHDAVRALEIYRKAGYQAERLSEFYEVCRGLESGRGQMFIKIEMPPTSFLTAMEEYAREAPCSLMLQQITVNDDRETTAEVRDIPKVELEVECKKEMDGRQNPNPSAILPEPPRSDQSEAAVVPHVIDLLGQAKLSQEASELDLRNSLALAIVTSENPLNAANAFDLTGQTTGWELAHVCASGSNGNAIAESKLAGGMDKLTLDSLYEDAMAKRINQNGAYHFGQVAPNPFEVAQYPQDPFYASSRIAPPTNVQMAAIAQQQQAFMMQQQQQPMIGQGPTNPFGNPFKNQGVQPYPPHNQGLI